MRKCKKCAALLIAMLTFSLMISVPMLFNHTQYAVRSPEKGLPMRTTAVGYPCTYYWLHQDEIGNVYARATYAIFDIHDDGTITSYHLDALPDSTVINIENDKILAYDMNSMVLYEYGKDGSFLGKHVTEDFEEIEQKTKVFRNGVVYEIRNSKLFNRVVCYNDGEEENYFTVLKSISKELRTYILSAIFVFHVITITTYFIHSKKHKKNLD